MSIRSGLPRRDILKSLAASSLALPLAAPVVRASSLPNPEDVLAEISVPNYVRADYRALYDMGGEPLWDPKKDWIRTVDWETVRSEQAGNSVRFAVGRADLDSAKSAVVPFEKLSGIDVDFVSIPDDQFYETAISEFFSGNPGFDALQFFSPWLGDFAAPGFLTPLDAFVEKWGLPLDDFYDTYRLNYGYFGDKGLYGIPFDCDIQMVHLRRSLAEKVLVGPIDRWDSVPSYDELIRITAEMDKLGGVSGLGMMLAPGFWSTYTWEHVAAQCGMDLFDQDWTPIFNSDAGVKGLELILALNANAADNASSAGWPENRADWLGGKLAANISWQDSGTQAMRPDQSEIVDDIVTIYEPRVAGGRFAPPNIAGSTSCVSATSRNPEGAFLLLAFLTTSSIMAMNEANANGVAPGYRSVLNNDDLKKVSQPLEVWSRSLDYAWTAPRIPGMFEMEQVLGNEINKAATGQLSAKEALDNGAAAWRTIMEDNGFFSYAEPIPYSAAEPGIWVGKGKAGLS